MGSKLLLPDTVLRSVFMPQNHFREPKNRCEHLLSSLPIVLPVAAVTISAAAFGLLFLQGDLVESAKETVTYTAAIGAADEQVEMYVYDAGNDEVEEAEEEASEMNAASSYAAKERILPAGEVEDTAELVDAYSSVPLFVSSGNLAEQGVQTRLELLEDYFPNGMYWNHVGVDTSEMTADEIAMCVTDTPCNHSVYGYGNCNIYNGLMDDFFPQYGDEMQCLGYASIISDLLFGYDAPVTEFYDIDELRIGDHIRMGWYEHSMIVTDIDWDTDTITVTEVNADYENCQISWGRQMSCRGTFYISQKLYDIKTPRTTQNRSGCADSENQLFNHVGNFACEIVVSLLEAFALLEANEIRNLHRAAGLLCFLSNVLLNGEIAVLNERLLQEAVVLIELADSAGNHLLDDVLRLFGVLRIVLDLSHEDFFFLIECFSRNRGLIEISRIQSGNLHCDVLAALVENFCRNILGLKTNENADSAAAVYVSNAVALVTDEATDLDVLADGENLILQHSINSHIGAVCLSCKESFNVCRVLIDNSLGTGLNEIDELSILRNEIGLSVDFNHNANLTALADHSVCNTLSCNTACLLNGSCKTLLAENLGCLLYIALSLCESLFAIHHAAACLSAQICNVLSCEIHFKSPFLVES